MLTARPVFAGETMSHVLAAVLTTEPDWTTLPAGDARADPHIAAAVSGERSQATARVGRRRAIDIDDALAAPPAEGRVVTRPRPAWQHWSIAATVLMVAVVAGASVWIAMRPAEPVPPRVSRLPLTPSGAAALSIDRVDARPRDHARRLPRRLRRQPWHAALRPRARRPRAGGGVHRRAARAVRLPDGQWIGFVDGTSVLKKVAVTGGPAVTLATLDGNLPRRHLGTG